jgi:AbrB family looped-hinge helix DNA binding protein
VAGVARQPYPPRTHRGRLVEPTLHWAAGGLGITGKALGRVGDRAPGLTSIISPSYVFAIVMATVTISPKFQVVIPLVVREALDLKAGEKLQVLQYGDRVELIPARPLKELRGLLRGMDPTIEREGDRL